MFQSLGANDTKHRCGLATVLDKMYNNADEGFVRFSERVLQLNTSHFMLNLIQIHAPTTDGNHGKVKIIL